MKTNCRSSSIVGAICGAVLIVSLPAEAQTTLWSGTITTESITLPSGTVIVGYNAERFGEISVEPAVFEYDGVAYRLIELLLVKRRDEAPLLALGLYDPALGSRTFLPDGRTFTLRIDEKTFSLSDARVDPRASSNLTWDDPGLDWSGGERVSVTLTEGEAPVPALPLAGVGLLALLLGVGAYRARPVYRGPQ
jgi:hypothetical protein